MNIVTTTLVSDRQIKRSVAQENSAIGKLSRQISSEKQHDVYSEISGDQIILLSSNARTAINLENQNRNNNLLLLKLDDYSAQLSSMQQLNLESIQLVKQVSTSINRNLLDIDELAFQKILALKDMLNVASNGYIFAGSKTDTLPVDLIEHIPNIEPDGTINNNYYRGNEVIQSQKISDDSTITYGQTAGDPVFRKFFAALHYIKNFSSSNNDDDITKADNLLNEVKIELQQHMSILGDQTRQVEQQISFNVSLIANANKAIEQLSAVDVAQLMSQLDKENAKIQALYKMYSMLQRTSYIDYMR